MKYKRLNKKLSFCGGVNKSSMNSYTDHSLALKLVRLTFRLNRSKLTVTVNGVTACGRSKDNN